MAGSRRWISLAATCTAAGLVWLAFADFGVATPTIADEMHADLGGLQWANNAFSLMAGALVIAAGRFGDIFGQRRILQIGILVFAACSVVAALAPGVGTLIVGRGLMGIGAALILPATLALIPKQFSGAAQLTAFGVWQAVAWGGQALAPAIGGVITDGPGWRWLFWINLPLALVAFLVIRAMTPESVEEDADRRIDWFGLATIGLAVFALLYALTDGPTAGWSSPLVVSLFVAAVVLAVAWVLIERRVAAPLVDLSLFRLRAYDGALTANLMMNLAYAGLSYLLVLWLQNARGYSAVEAGLLMLPATIGIFALIPVGGRLDSRLGGRVPVLIGLVVLAIGMAVLGPLHADSSMWLVAVALVAIGCGLGLLSTPISNTAVGDVPGRLSGTAAGVFKMSSMVGGALGVALLTAITRGLTIADSDRAIQDSGLTGSEVDQARGALVNSSSFADALSRLPAELQKKVTDAVVIAFSHGLGMTMVVTAFLIVVATAAVWWLWPRRGAVVETADADSAP
ncbi:MFS transporter [Gordonia insulae]|uniref:Quinolone resistance protein NorB n=1 Tax=Gordonia insulae TaxID=2420509 RepID=A0A3G8JQK8_9ACTN|nr:MFS transporter [Gordonia insulae]AZG47401.1 Quinolone resistance protein NorB [Gordonia insulae]